MAIAVDPVSYVPIGIDPEAERFLDLLKRQRDSIASLFRKRS